MPSTEQRDEQQAPPRPPTQGLRWPGRSVEESGAEQPPAPSVPEQKRAEQSHIRAMTDAEKDDWARGRLGSTSSWTPEQPCASCHDAAVPGMTRCQRCIDENPPQDYVQLRERHPNLPVRRPNEARRFA